VFDIGESGNAMRNGTGSRRTETIHDVYPSTCYIT
jgi:hypothetical protein